MTPVVGSKPYCVACEDRAIAAESPRIEVPAVGGETGFKPDRRGEIRMSDGICMYSVPVRRVRIQTKGEHLPHDMPHRLRFSWSGHGSQFVAQLDDDEIEEIANYLKVTPEVVRR